jgi:lysine-N-methylase
MSSSISLPTIQNWSCHSCGDCCRHHQIIVTDADRERILGQMWSSADGVPEGEAAFARVRGGQYRLAHRADGACVFLDENNRCRIHAKFGEAAKPLACRVYPFAFFPTGERSVALGLRFDCPSAVANRGAPLKEQGRAAQAIADLVVPSGGEARNPPWISARGGRLDWTDTLRIVRGLRAIVAGSDDGTPLPVRLIHALFVAGMLGQATYEKVRGDRIDELIDTLAMAAPPETARTLGEMEEPSGLARAQFRLVAAQYSMRDSLADRGLGYRLGKALAGLRLARGKGRTPATRPGLGRVPFAEIERTTSGRNEEVDRLLARYLDLKLSGMGFCGLGCYGMDVVEGFESLVLLHPIVMFIARWLARGRGAESVELADVERAVAIIDHHHGRSPAMGMGNFRRRVRWLAEKGEIARLVAWYGK